MPPPPRVTFRRVAVSLRGPGQSTQSTCARNEAAAAGRDAHENPCPGPSPPTPSTHSRYQWFGNVPRYSGKQEYRDSSHSLHASLITTCEAVAPRGTGSPPPPRAPVWHSIGLRPSLQGPGLSPPPQITAHAARPRPQAPGLTTPHHTAPRVTCPGP